MAERRVSADRFATITRQARQLAPFSGVERHRPVAISVLGALRECHSDPDDPNYLKARLLLEDGQAYTITIPRDREDQLPAGRAEWVVPLGEAGDPFVRAWHAPA